MITAKALVKDPTFKAELSGVQLTDALFLCCELGHAAAVLLLLDLGVKQSAKLATDNATPLHVACRHCRNASASRIVDDLLAAQADPNARMCHDITPLLIACDYAAGLEVICRLLAAGASCNAHMCLCDA